MKRLWSLVAVAALAGVVLATADARTGAGKPFCKRTASAAKPYVLRRGAASALKPADIAPVPAGGCPRTVMTAAAGGTALGVALTGEAETPAGDPVATGTATIRLRAGEGRVCYRIAAENLPTAVAAHIHRGASGVAGPVVVALKPPGSNGQTSGCAPASRSVVRGILAGPAGYYVNVHTQEFAGGAIRGQLRGTSTSTFGWAVALALKGTSEPNATGSAVVRIRKDAGLVCYRLTAQNITLPAVAAHIHRGAAGVNGPVVVPFTAPQANGTSDGCAQAQPSLIDEILANPAGFYVNVHTQEHPAGAIRAQLG
ncbi:MAG TPA: CHRD domain-containing protein [Gaiellaceae bacterium]|nr:CHRD domain-containing protein [Gaiellaceae bacterium]